MWLVDLGNPIGSESADRRPAMVVGSALHCSFPIVMALVALSLCTHGRPGPVPPVAVDWAAAGLTLVHTEDVRAASERRLVDRHALGPLTGHGLAKVRGFFRLMVEG